MKKLAFILLVSLLGFNVYGQKATLAEEIVSIDTYGFGKPNPVPMLADNPKIFPYFKFEEYEHRSQKKNWKVITLENDYIQVFILPEIGGKVWGAIEKSTGKEFLYKNKVVKFRNIALRGPWTSGGIEMNFGIIGHHPGTATPVDYTTRENSDGSVSCFVSNTDLPSNTRWNVEIRLEKDKAYFETNASWYNASPITESYYNWMTAAAVVSEDLQFFIPGNAYLEHDGTAHTWPIDDKGRDLSFYKNNNFGPAKSYHIVGEYNDFFGGYYHDRNFGFGQWSPYEEMPGQKLWLWSLARSGGIWEDLLTDSDGQYIEFQAGRLLDQYSPGAVNPISQVGFDPYMMDTWSEIWFPFKDIGGMVDASKHGALNVEMRTNGLYVGLNPFQNLDREMEVLVNNEVIFSTVLDLKPMEIYSKIVPASNTDKIEVVVKGTELYYTNEHEKNLLKRPFYPDTGLTVSESESYFQEGLEAMEFREYTKAHDLLSNLMMLDSSHRAGLVKLAELEYRKTNYDTALEHGNAVLKMDTYDAGANYIMGLSYRATNDKLNALESFGWAARDIKYRSVSYAQMAELYIASENYERAKLYANKALDFNTYNLNARKVLAVAARKNNNSIDFKNQIDAILKIDALNFFALAETNFMNSEQELPKVRAGMKNEFSTESILDLAIQYQSLGLAVEAARIVSLDLSQAKNKLWLSYLLKDSNPLKSKALLAQVEENDIDFVFPFRRETVPVLKWAVARQPDSWKLTYYLAQNYLATGLTNKAKSMLQNLGNKPDSDIFYRFRAGVLKEENKLLAAEDYAVALKLNPKDWKIWEENIRFALDSETYQKAADLSSKAFKRFPENYSIGLLNAQSLVSTRKYKEVLRIFENIQILPFEHANQSRKIYERAHIGIAIDMMENKKFKEAVQILNRSREWPENLGVGKPFSPDERMQQYLLALCHQALENRKQEEDLLEEIARYTQENEWKENINNLFGLLSLKKLDKQQELQSKLLKLEKETDRDNLKHRLVLALFNNEEKELQRLKEKHLLTQDMWKAFLFASK
ncbi:DUF5107 domain-containing protein [Maribacter chungangensis]|uniref:DUF5107 domain-containing protein n=1 Tax=Maribacter chungangensis TaxID=1069117 RepID=A0ABW3AZP8_9FLAO